MSNNSPSQCEFSNGCIFIFIVFIFVELKVQPVSNLGSGWSMFVNQTDIMPLIIGVDLSQLRSNNRQIVAD